MTKQMTAAMAAMLMVGALPMQAQEPLTTTTKTVKVAPGETKTTVITKEAGATDAKPAARSGTHKRTTRRKPAAKRAPAESETSRMLRELREKQTAQQAEIDALTQANATKDAALAQAQAEAQAAQTQAQSRDPGGADGERDRAAERGRGAGAEDEREPICRRPTRGWLRQSAQTRWS